MLSTAQTSGGLGTAIVTGAQDRVPLASSLEQLHNNLGNAAENLSYALNRLRGAQAEVTGGAPPQKEMCVSERVLDCHAIAGRLNRLADELNGLV